MGTRTASLLATLAAVLATAGCSNEYEITREDRNLAGTYCAVQGFNEYDNTDAYDRCVENQLPTQVCGDDGDPDALLDEECVESVGEQLRNEN